jgi:hypothetical protein
MKKMILMMFLITSITSSFAGTIQKGEAAPFTGILLTKERAEVAMKAEKSNIVLRDLGMAQEELTEYHRDAARVARTELTKSQVKGYIHVIGAFILGVVVTGFAAKMNNKIQEI